MWEIKKRRKRRRRRRRGEREGEREGERRERGRRRREEGGRGRVSYVISIFMLHKYSVSVLP